MGDEDGMVGMGDAADIAGMACLLGAIVFVDVQRASAAQPLFEGGRHRLVGLVHVGEQRIAAGRRQFERVEEGVFVGPRGIARVDVEPEFALAEGADRLPVDLDVGDQKDLLVVLKNAFGAVA